MLVLTWALMLCRATLPDSLAFSSTGSSGTASVHAAHIMSGQTLISPLNTATTDCCADWQSNSPPASEDRDLSATWELSHLWTLLAALTLLSLNLAPWHQWRRHGCPIHPSPPPLYLQHCTLLH